MNGSGFHVGAHACRPSRRQLQRGSALVEYTIVVLSLIVALVVGEYTHSIPYLVDKLREAYASFVYALSISWN